MARTTIVVASWVLAALAACGVEVHGDRDGGRADPAPSRDAGGADAGSAADAGSLADAGALADAGSPPGASVSADAGSLPDAATTDAGQGGDAGAPLVVVTDGVEDEGRTCLRIATPVATYLYDRDGAGLTSLLDRDGHDWIGWRTGGWASGEYRGIPNMGRCCHPGYEGATTRVLVAEHDLVRIESTGVAAGDPWRLTWDFTPEHATLTVHAAPGRYYLQYEGTPGGSLGPEDYFVTSQGAETMTSIDTEDELITEDLPDPEWIYFADAVLGRGLLLVHHEDDDIGDRYWTMSHAMTVFGFGRTAMAGITGLHATPQHMTIAIIDDIDFPTAAATADALLP